jgi:hypothetical protein
MSALDPEIRDALILIGITRPLLAILLLAGLCLTLLFLLRFTFRYRQLRGEHVLFCPELDIPVVIRVNSPGAAVSGRLSGPDFYVTKCSCWPERYHCGQGCLAEIRRRVLPA